MKKKKILKGLYCLGLMLLTAGAFCFVGGWLKTGKSAERAEYDQVQTQAQTTSLQDNESQGQGSHTSNEELPGDIDGYWTDGVKEGSLDDLMGAPTGLGGTLAVAGTTFYKISDATQLATVAYNIVKGDDSWANANYILTKNLSLSGKYWTGVGTKAHPFAGTFYGAGHTIENIYTTETASTTSGGNEYTGLFGYCDGAKIVNLKVGAYYHMGHHLNYCGSLMADGENTYIIDCQDTRTDIAQVECKTIGRLQSGGIYDDGNSNNRVVVANPAGQINGYAYQLQPGDANADMYQFLTNTHTFDQKLDDRTTGFYPYILTTAQISGSSISANGSVSNIVTNVSSPAVLSSLPGLRASATATNKFFIVNTNNTERGKATTGKKLSSWTVGNTNLPYTLTATWSSNTTIPITVDYNYASYNNKIEGTNTKRTSAASVGYDCPITPAWNNERIGYTIAKGTKGTGFYTKSSGGVEVGSGDYYGGDEIDTATKSNTTYTFYAHWTINQDHAFKVEKVMIDGDKSAVSQAFSSESGVEPLTVTQDTTDLSLDDQGNYAGHTPNEQIKIKFTLGYGYTLKTISNDSSTAYNKNLDSQGTNWLFYESTEGVAGSAHSTHDAGGLYNKGTYTGTGTSYKVGGGNDPYSRIKATISSDDNRTYTITVDNMVAETTLQIVICRQVFRVADKYMVDHSDNVKNASLSGNSALTVFKNGYIYTRINEAFTYTVNEQVIMNPTLVGIDNKGVTFTPDYGSDKDSAVYEKYHFAKSFKMIVTAFGATELGNNDDRCIDYQLWSLQLTVSAEKKYADGKGESWPTDLPTVGVNGVSQWETGDAKHTAKVEISNGDFVFKVKYLINPYYELTDKSQVSISPDSDKFEILDLYSEGENRIITIKLKAPDSTEDLLNMGAEYNVTFNFTKVKYALSILYKINNQEVEDTTLAKYLTKNAGTTDPTYVVGETVTLTIPFSEFGGRVLYIKQASDITGTAGGATASGKITYNGQDADYGTLTVTVTIAKDPTSALDESYNKVKQAILINLTTRNFVFKFAEKASAPTTAYAGSGSWTDVKNAIIPSAPTITASVNVASAEIQFPSNISGVDIISGYYFLNWYLVNGEVVTSITDTNKLTTVDGIYKLSDENFKNQNIIQALTTAARTAADGDTDAGDLTFEVVGTIKAKQITITLDASQRYVGDELAAGNGLIYYKNGDSYVDVTLEAGQQYLTQTVSYTHATTIPEIDMGQHGIYRLASIWKGWKYDVDGYSITVDPSKADAYKFSTDELAKLFGETKRAAAVTDANGVTYYNDKTQSDPIAITFYPIFENRVDSIQIKDYASADSVESLSISIGATITLDNGEGNSPAYTITSTVGESRKTNERRVADGYHAVSFSVKRNGDSSGTSIKSVDKAFTLTEDNVKTLLSGGDERFTTSSGTVVYILEITNSDVEENIYEVTIKLQAYETLYIDGQLYDGYNGEVKAIEYVFSSVKYQEDLTKTFEHITIKRNGYTLSGLQNDGGDIFAEYSGDAWTGSHKYNQTADTTLNPSWTRNEQTWLQVEVTGTSKVYNGTQQQVASASAKTGAGDAATALGDEFVVGKDLGNGENIATGGIKWYKVQGEKQDPLNSTTSLWITGVNENPSDTLTYKFVVTILDQKTQTTYDIVVVVDQSSDAKITKNTIKIVGGEELQSYYSGTGTFYGVEGHSTLGTATYGTGGSAISGVANLSVAITGNSGYAAEGSYTALYTFNLDDATAANFSNIEGSSGTYTLTQGTIAVIKTPLTVTVTGNGLAVAADVKHNPGYTVAETVTGKDIFKTHNFTFEGTLETNSGVAGTYTYGDEAHNVNWTNSYHIKLGGQDVTSNFDTLTFAGSYEIKDANGVNAHIFDFNVMNISAANNALSASVNSNAKITFASFTISVAGADQEFKISSISENALYNFAYNGSAILAITGYNTTKLHIIILNSVQDQAISFSFTLQTTAGTETYKFFGYMQYFTDAASIPESISTQIKAGVTTATETLQSNPYTQAATALTNATLVYSNVKVIRLQHYDSHAQDILLSVGGSVEIENPTRTGFDFKNWTGTVDKVTFQVGDGTGKTTFTAESGATVVKVDAGYTAQWAVAAPTIATKDRNITKYTSEKGFTVSRTEVVPNAEIKNYFSGLAYTFTWFKTAEDQIGEGPSDSITLTDVFATVTYKIQVTATYSGDDANILQENRTATSAQIDFTITVVKAQLKVVVGEGERLTRTYNGKDQKADFVLSVQILNGDQVVETVDHAIGVANRGFNFTISYTNGTTETTTEILNAGSYSITLTISNTNVYSDTIIDANHTITISKADLTPVEGDFTALKKKFGQQDPSFTFTKNGQAGEEIEFVYERSDKGETVGTYGLTRKSVTYKSERNVGQIIITPETNYTISNPKFTFTIEALSTSVYVALGTEARSITYSSQAITAEFKYDTDWKLILHGANGVEDVTISIDGLYFENADGLTVKLKTDIENALTGFTIALFKTAADNAPTEAINVGSYYLKQSGEITNKNFSGVGFCTVAGDSVSAKTNSTTVQITKKTITIKSVTKTFDGKATFTAEQVEAEGIIKNEVTITGTLNSANVKDQNGLEKTNVTVNGAMAGNYDVEIAEDFKATITASSAQIYVDGKKEFIYGEIEETITSPQLELTITADGIDNALELGITVGNITIKNIVTSTSEHLVVGTYNLEVTLSSDNFTPEALSGREVKATIKITVKTLSLKGSTVNKNYDGNTNLVSPQWTFDGKVGNDNITLTGQYENAMPGTHNIVELALAPASDDNDNENYELAKETITGSIGTTTVILKTLAEYETYKVEDGEVVKDVEFVKDTLTVTKQDSFTISYPTEYSFKNDLEDPTREGYQFEYWAYFDGVSLVKIDSDAALKAALDLAYEASGEDFYIYAMWSIETYTITFAGTNVKSFTVDESVGTSYTAKYWDTFTVKIEGTDGHKFGNAEFNQSAFEGVQVGDKHTRTGGTVTFTNVTKAIDGGTLTVTMNEISLTITVDYNDGKLLEKASTETAGWTDTKTRTLSYSEVNKMMSEVLPELKIAANTYKQTNWEESSKTYDMESIKSTNLWQIFSHDDALLDDDKADITFKANWEALPITLTISIEEQPSVLTPNADVVVKVGESPIEGQQYQYSINYGSDVTIEITGHTGYKYASYESAYTAVKTEETSGKNTKKATLTIKTLKSAGTLTINIETIKVERTVEKNTPAQLIDNDITIEEEQATLVFNEIAGEKVKTSVNVTALEGTYTLAGYKYQVNGQGGQTDLDNDAIYSAILGTDPTTDMTLTLIPQWTAVTYVVSFDANADDEPVVQDPGSIEVKFGETFTIADGHTLPTLEREGYASYQWQFDGSPVNGGNVLDKSFVTKDTFDPETMQDGKGKITLVAKWTKEVYKLKIVKSGSHFASVTANSGVIEKDTVDFVIEDEMEIVATFTQGYQLKTAVLTGVEGIEPEIVGNKVTFKFTVAPDNHTDATLTLTESPITYKLYIKTQTGETLTETDPVKSDDTGKYVEIAYDAQYSTSQLDKVTITRAGYKFVKWVFVSGGEGDIWTAGQENGTYAEKTYQVAGNSDIKAVWEALGNYYSATLSEDKKSTATYNGKAQTLATATVSPSAPLTNGDEITEYYWVINDEQHTRVSEGNSYTLTLTNVTESKEYILAIVVKDTIQDNKTRTYYLDGSKHTTAITKNTIKANEDWTLESYYTGSNAYVATSNHKVGTFGYGTWSESDENKIEGLKFDKVIIQGSKFDVTEGTGYTARIYFTLSEDLAKNFTLPSDENGNYVEVTSKVKVVATPITLTASGSGFANGHKHEFKLTPSTAIQGVDLQRFTITATGTTQGSEAGTYTANADESKGFDKTTFTVKLSGADVDEKNFAITLAGSYEIKDVTGNAKVITLSTKELKSESLLQDNTAYTITVSSVSIGRQSVSINGRAFYNHVVDGEVVFTLGGNGTNNFVIALANGKTATFTVTIGGFTGKSQVLAFYTGTVEASTAIETLKTLSEVESPTKAYTLGESDITETIVITALKAIKIDGEGGDVTYQYIDLSSADHKVDVEKTPTKKGFEFKEWTTKDTDITLDGEKKKTVTAQDSATITFSTITASWTLAKPTLNAVEDPINRDANPDGIQVSVGEVLTITDQSAISEFGVTYTYAWFVNTGDQAPAHGDVAVANGDTATGLDGKGGEHKYVLIVTAHFGGETTDSELAFSVNVAKVKIAFAEGTETVTKQYAYKDYASEINVNIKFTYQYPEKNESKPYNLANKEYLSFKFEKGEAQSETLKDAGTYTVTLQGGDYYEVSGTSTFTVTISTYNYEITLDDLQNAGLYKYLGQANPELQAEIQITFEEERTETITVKFTCNGLTEESHVGTYDLTISNAQDLPNYTLTLAGNAKFEVRKPTFAVQLQVNGTLSKTYNAKATTLTTAYAEGEWKFKIDDTDTDVTIKLIVVGDGSLTDEMKAEAFNGVTFSLYNSEIVSDGKNAGTYSVHIDTVPGSIIFTNITFSGTVNLTVNKKQISITGIEKQFDRTPDLAEGQYSIQGVESTDTVKVSGHFDDAELGDKKTATFNIVSGGENYELASEGKFEGKITINTQEVTLSQFAGSDSYQYGLFKQSMDNNLEQIRTALNGKLNMKIGEGQDEDLFDTSADILKYVTVNLAFSNPEYSTGNYVKAGSLTITVTLTSKYYQNVEDKSTTITITIAKLKITLDQIEISKDYDTNNKVTIAESAWGLEGKILDGDKVTLTESTYDNEQPGTGKTITLVPGGADKDNYDFADNHLTGEIKRVTVTLNVDAKTLPDGVSWVSDGLTPNVTVNKFTVEYPFAGTAGETLGRWTVPTRVGYNATGWYYKADGENKAISSTDDSFTAVLKAAFEAEDGSKSITIYVTWVKNEYTITFDGITNIGSITAEQEEVAQKDSIVTWKVHYYDEIVFDLKASRGYKITDAALSADTATKATLTKTQIESKNTGKITIAQIKDNATIDITTENIKVTIEFTDGEHEGATTLTNPWGVTTKEFDFNSEELNKALKDVLPALTLEDGTYTLSGWTFKENGDVDDSYRVDTPYPKETEAKDPEGDFTISVIAKWTGVDYTLKFDAGEGAEIEKTYSLKFGQTISEVLGDDADLPTPTLAGRTGHWEDAAGKTYTKDDKLLTIGQREGEGWTLTLQAKYTNNTYQLTIKIDQADKANFNTLLDGNTDITDNYTKSLTYGETRFDITIIPNEGYDYSLTWDKEEGSYQTERNDVAHKLTVYNITDNVTMTIKAVARTNILSITVAHASLTDAKVSGDNTDGFEKQTEPLQVLAKTGSSVEMTFTADDGYEFVESTIQANLSGSGEITTKVEGGQLIVTWQNFKNAATLTVSATPKKNKITLQDATDVALQVTFNSVGVALDGNGYGEFETGTTLKVNVTLKYGYENAAIEIVNSDLHASPRSGALNNSSRLWEAEFEITGFTSAISIKITAQARQYGLLIKSDNEDRGSVSPESARLPFTEEQEKGPLPGTFETLTATATEGYVFAGWYFRGNSGDIFISAEEEFKLAITAKYQTALEDGDANRTVVIIGKFDLAVRNIQVVIGQDGEAILNVAGDTTEQLGSGADVTREFEYGFEFVLQLMPRQGYEVASVKFTDRGTGEIQGTEWYDAEQNKISFTVNGQSPAKIEVTFKASKAVVTVEALVRLNHLTTAGSFDAGTIKLCDENGNTQSHGYEIEGDGESGLSYKVISHTDDVLYFVVDTKEGYELTFSGSTGISIDSTDKPNVVRVSGIVDGAKVSAIFTAKANGMTVLFVDEDGTNVPAGQISVTDAALVAVTGNNSSNVYITAQTGVSQVSITVYTGFNYSFVMADELPTVSITGLEDTDGHATASNYQTFDSDMIRRSGLTSSFTLIITGVASLDGRTIQISVQPKTYTVQFNDGSDIIANVKIEGVTLGGEFAIDPAIQAQIGFKARNARNLVGYYTLERAQGVKYVNGDGSVAKTTWTESGYTYNGSVYEVSQNFNPDTSTFTLFAAWAVQKASVQVRFSPEILRTNHPLITYADIFPTLSSASLWADGADKLQIEVLAGTHVEMKKYDLEDEDYLFVRWEITKTENGEALPVQIISGEEANPSFETGTGSIDILMVYYVKFGLGINRDGFGSVRLMQDGEDLTESGAFDPSKPVTIIATPKTDEGYEFVGWYDADGENLVFSPEQAPYNDGLGGYVYTYESLDTPLYLQAKFVGKELHASIDTSKLGSENSFDQIKLADGTVLTGEQLLQPFDVRVGDELEVKITMQHGYMPGWEGNVNFAISEEPILGEGNMTTYVLTYTVDYNDREGADIIKIVPIASANSITYKVQLGVIDSPDSQTEASMAGVVTYLGEEVTTIETRFGTDVILNYRTLANYTLDSENQASVVININGTDYFVPNMIGQNERVTIDARFVQEHAAVDVVTITINFRRVYWTESASSSLKGSGTGDNPYIIESAEDLAFVAKQVNAGVEGYANANYRVESDLNFEGKYWTPIGTHENAFNGTIDFGTYQVTNVTHEPFTTYENPEARFNGLFWVCSDSARIIQAHPEIVIALSVVGAFLGLLLIILIIILILRRRRKKRMEELANS